MVGLGVTVPRHAAVIAEAPAPVGRELRAATTAPTVASADGWAR